MKIYTVHVKQGLTNPLEDAVFVKEGFSLWAAILQILWTIYNKMWICSAVLFAISILFVLLERNGIISVEVAGVLKIGVFALIGFEANNWYQKSLESRGFTLFDTVSGTDLLDAQRRFYDKHTSL